MLYVAIWYVSIHPVMTKGRIETYQIATYSIRTLLKMHYWSPKHVELLNVMNKMNHQILCILLDYIYITSLDLNHMDCYTGAGNTTIRAFVSPSTTCFPVWQDCARNRERWKQASLLVSDSTCQYMYWQTSSVYQKTVRSHTPANILYVSVLRHSPKSTCVLEKEALAVPELASKVHIL